ncbi:MAG: response regulator [Pirellulaceae bacterium]|nr:response regulator [Pirellulaceae bacterium]
MSNVLRLAVVDPHDSSREFLKSMLLGMDIVWLEAECSRYEFFTDVVNQTSPEVGIVALDSDPEKGLALLEDLRNEAPNCQILVTSSNNDSQLILRAMRAGAKEFLTLPLEVEDLVSSLERIGSLSSTEGKTRGSSVIAVAGVTGGVGSTSLAVNLGCVLANQPGNSVVVMDIDLALGDADVYLDAIPDYTLVDVSQNVSRLDFALLKRSLTKHSSGVYLLPRPIQLQECQDIQEEGLRRVIGLLKASFSHLVIDVSKSFSPLDMVALRSASQILLVTQLDLPCLRNVVRLLMSFDEEPELKEKIRVVMNRVGLNSGQISLKKAQETIGREIYWQLPNDYRTMVEVRNNGVPLIEQAPKAGITQSVIALADALMGNGEQTSQEIGTKANWFNFWGKKKEQVT